MGRTETERRPAAAVLLRRYFSRRRNRNNEKNHLRKKELDYLVRRLRSRILRVPALAPRSWDLVRQREPECSAGHACRWPARYGRKVVEKQDDGGHRQPDLELALFDVVCLGVVLLLPPWKAVARPGLDARVLAYIMPTICAMICLG
ncbi:uncharacterized protein LOC119299599 [Triticum dicoccoides]|uniref:uncharacterized protein LOC119299599 n=1 Tax=Triticum dicoccoides TaxID=85692 RepID=UPI00188EFB40|nr:uncharacterized protein LOC119299599 [Triticum dicoccoides]